MARMLAIMAIGTGMLLAACSQSSSDTQQADTEPAAPASGAPTKLSEDDVKPIVTALAYKQELHRFCGEDDDSADVFIDELNGELKARARVWREVVKTGFEGTEAEYVCTPEMFEDKNRGAADALESWKQLQ